MSSKAAAKPATDALPLTPPAPAPAATAVAAVTAFKYAIEDGIPLPVKRAGFTGETAYPYKELAVGQAFFVPSSDKMKEPWKTLTSMSSRISRELHPKQFTTARVQRDGVDGVRIWRKPDTEQPLKAPKVLNRKAKGNAAALAAEAVDGDTSQRQHPAPDFVDANTPAPAPAPPPMPPAA